MYSDFFFELSCKNTQTHTHTQKHTHTHTHRERDSNEYPIVAFSKNATIIRRFIKQNFQSFYGRKASLLVPILPVALLAIFSYFTGEIDYNLAKELLYMKC